MSEKRNLDEILNNFNHDDESGFQIEIDGVFMPNTYNKFKDVIQNFVVYDDDVWVCTFPKSGTTWAQEMVWLLCNNLDYKAAEEELDLRFPYFDHIIRLQAFLNENFKKTLPAHMQDSINYVKNMKRPRHIKCHLPWVLLPKQIQSGEKKPKIIYVSRNPKDACVSLYHHLKLFQLFKGTIDELVQVYIADKGGSDATWKTNQYRSTHYKPQLKKKQFSVMYAPYWDHVLAFHKNKNDHIIHIRFEEMKSDLQSVILKLAKFLGKNIDRNDLTKLVYHLSFEQLKKNKAVNKEVALDMLRKADSNLGNGFFMRQGKSGNYKEEMNSEQIQAFDRWIDKHTKNTDFIL